MKRLAALLPMSVCLALLPCSALAGTVTVHIFDFDFGDNNQAHFDPIINLGDTIHWVWDEGFHSTTSAAGLSESWDSGNGLPSSFPNGFNHTFTNTGTFEYYCRVHGGDNGNGTIFGMGGRITVVPAPSALFTFCLGALPCVGMALRRRKNASG